MSFVNNYTTPEFTFHYAEEFMEGGSSFTYGLANTDDVAVIVKMNSSGTVVWQRSQNLTPTDMRLHEIIQLNLGQGSVRYVLTGTQGVYLYLMAIDTSGNLVWSKRITTGGTSVRGMLEAVPGGNDFYLVYTNPTGSEGVAYQPIILKFDKDGTRITQTALSSSAGVHSGMIINAIKAHNGGLVLAGNILLNTGSRGFTIDLSTALAVGARRLVSTPLGFLSQIIIKGTGDYVLTGYSNIDLGAYVTQINGTGIKDFYLFPNSQGCSTALANGGESYYVSVYNDTTGHVYKLAQTTFNVQWLKIFRPDSTGMPVKTLNYLSNTSSLTSTFVNDSYVIRTNSALDSCITVSQDSSNLTRKQLTVTEFPVLGGKTTPTEVSLSLILNDAFSVPQNVCGKPLELNNTMLQSSHLYLQAAGSLGVDSTEGIHLRWLLKNGLAKHLPKGKYATTTDNFNKPEDYVRIYRARYVEYNKVTLNMAAAPQLADDANSHWLYSAGGLGFDVWFRNTAKYATVRASFNPMSNPVGFLQAYGAELIEIEQQTELAFAVELNFNITGSSSNAAIELLSVEENAITAPKRATYRKKQPTSAVTGTKLFSENIRSVRFRANGANIVSAEFEFYSGFVRGAYDEKEWEFIGEHALTLDTNLAFYRLEPIANSVNGHWLRYNDDACTNTDNYRTKWNSPSLDPDQRIQDTVERYITLSDVGTNPEAIETISYADPSIPPGPEYDPSDNEFELSNLYVLQLASMDYHMARMLGLGVLDLSSPVYSGQYIYLAEYVTYGDLQDGLGAREVQHIYCSLPTALADERLPLPVDLQEPVPGIFQGLGTEAPSPLTDAAGYSVDGKTRFISLFHEDLPEEAENAAFFYHNYEFISAESTIPVYAGIEYRLSAGSHNWQKPELPFDKNYFNIDPAVDPDKRNETRPIILPDPGYPVFVHREKHSGWHDYSSYGINWFSRATSSDVIHSIETVIVPENLLQPPTNINAVLIRPESPLLLTSADEQTAYAAITNPDKTFIRLTFDYNHGQELIDYHKEINGELISGYTELPDNEELFAEDIEVFFRNEVPNSISGKIVSVADDTNPLLSVITTGDYELLSVTPPDNLITPVIPSGMESNFIGSALTVDGSTFIIHTIDNTGLYPEFTVFKNDANGFPVALTTSLTPGELTAPTAGGLFIIVENMLSPASWNAPNPLSFTVNIDQTTVHNETITITLPDTTTETHVEKFRGVYESAFIEKILEDHDEDPLTADIHLGMYKLTFTNPLAQHSQAAGPGHRVEWYKGVVRVHTDGDPNGPRKNLQVLRTENIGTSTDLVVYAVDAAFDTDPSYDGIAVGNQSVNYYPGYRVYLYEDTTYGLDETSILPGPTEDIRYSIFGLRSHDQDLSYVSKISTPVLMYAQKIEEPLAPRTPVGGLYATRPDYFGKASYTFTTVYDHKPYSVQFGRASDVQILSALWRNDTPSDPLIWTVQRIQDEIFERGEADWYNERWQNLLGFDYTYLTDPANDGFFERFPDSSGTSLPLPNNPNFIDAINAFIDQHNDDYGTSIPPISAITSLDQIVILSSPQNAELQIWHFVRDVIHNCFVPLTEIPVIYQYVKGPGYDPIPKKQVIRDERGDLLSTTDPEFDMAPMMKVIGPNPLATPPKTDHETQFTDFGLDGASNAKYFYISREFNLQMKAGPYSAILGPINMVNAAPPRAPEVVKIVPILENRNANIEPSIELNLNAYATHQHIQKITIYRATSLQNALSVRTMDQVKVVDFATEPVSGDVWSVQDDFSDLGYVPYGDPLFYMLTVSREVKYNDRDGNPVTEYQPSEPSKLTVTNIVENYNPESPELSYTADPPNIDNEIDNVEISWDKTVHNGKYHLQKRNEKGNWIEIAVIQDNAATITVDLATTSLASSTLALEDADGNRVYHIFKVVAENFAGMLSRDEKILSI